MNKKYKIIMLTAISISAVIATSVVVVTTTNNNNSAKQTDNNIDGESVAPNAPIFPTSIEVDYNMYNQVGGGYLDLWNLALEQGFSDDSWSAQEILEDAVSKASNNFGHKYFNDWYNSLTKENFLYNVVDVKNDQGQNIKATELFCSSEKQALELYLNNNGHYWNEFLQNNEVPPNACYNKKFFPTFTDYIKTDEAYIRGTDYKYLESSLSKANMPINIITYHGVEYMEKDFYNQLSEYIAGDDYSMCVGKKIHSNGFLSTTFQKANAIWWASGENWTKVDPVTGTSPLEPPFGRRVTFEIKIPLGTNGAAYVSDFNFINKDNPEEQILINRNKDYLIEGVDIVNQGLENESIMLKMKLL